MIKSQNNFLERQSEDYKRLMMVKEPNIESRFGGQHVPQTIDRSFSKSSGFKVFNAMGMLVQPAQIEKMVKQNKRPVTSHHKNSLQAYGQQKRIPTTQSRVSRSTAFNNGHIKSAVQIQTDTGTVM